jgi:CBS-domain-containing membrane protein
MEYKAEAVMTAEVVTARPTSSFRELVRLLQQHRISAVPIVDDSGRLVGIVSEADLLVKEGYPHGTEDVGVVDAIRQRRRLGKATGTCAAELMATPVITIPRGSSVVNAARLMMRLGVKRLPVVDAQGKLVGIVARSDLLKVFLRPDPAIRWEVEHDVVCGRLGIPAGDLQVEVRHGVVAVRGEVERRSQISALVRQVQAVDGVIEVDAQLSWRIDDQMTTTPWPVR